MSEFHQTLLQVYLIKIDVELVRFGILVDGVDMHKIANINGQISTFIEEQLISILRKAKNLASDFPMSVQDDIMAGRFA